MGEIEKPNMISKTTQFARGRISQVLTVEQNRIVNLAMGLVREDEDPEAQAQYVLSIPALAKEWGKGERTLARNLEKAAKDLDASMPHLHYDEIVNGELQHVHGPIFQDIRVGTAPKRLIVRFAYDIRKALIAMKREYDIIYPVQTPSSFEHKYTPMLHDFLLAKMRDQVDDGHTGNRFQVDTSIEEMRETIPFNWEQQKATSKFNSKVIKEGCKDLNEHSEIYIENEMPEQIKEKLKTVGYKFKIVLRSSLITPVFPIHSKALKVENEIPKLHNNGIPTFDYILNQLRLEKVNDSYIMKVESQHDAVRAWKALLYARLHAKNPARYFNAAYEGKKFVIEQDSEELLEGLLQACPSYKDEVLQAIMDFYEKRKENIRKEINNSLEETKFNRAHFADGE